MAITVEDLILEAPENSEDYRYVVLPDGTAGWIELTQEEKDQRVLDAQKAIERRKVKVVSMFQARAALIQAGLFDTVDQMLQQEGGVNLQAWEYATEVRRDSELVQSMAAALNLTDEQVDALFAAAKQIAV